MIPDDDGEAFSKHTPYNSVTAASLEFFGTLAKVCDDGFTQLRGFPCHYPAACSIISILGFAAKEVQELVFDVNVNVRK